MRARRSIFVVLAMLSALLVATSVAWACTAIRGTTKISGSASYPTSGKIYAGNTVPNISVATLPSTFNGTTWQIVATRTRGQYCMTYTNTLVSSVTVNTSSSPNLGPVNGTAPSAGVYDVCAVHYVGGSADSTNPAVLTVS